MLGTIAWHDHDGCRSIPLVGQEVVIGRSAGHAVVLESRQASRRHARLFALGGRYFVEDLHSQNGTRCDGVRVDSPRCLNGHHKLQIGDEQIEIDMKPQAATEQERPSVPPWRHEHRDCQFRCWWKVSWTQFVIGWGWEETEA